MEWLGEIWSILPGKSTAIAGKVTVTAGSPVSLPDQPCGEGATFIAGSANAGLIYLYPASGSKDDVMPLAAGDSVFWPVGNLNALKADASADNQSLHWMGAV